MAAHKCIRGWLLQPCDCDVECASRQSFQLGEGTHRELPLRGALFGWLWLPLVMIKALAPSVLELLLSLHIGWLVCRRLRGCSHCGQPMRR